MKMRRYFAKMPVSLVSVALATLFLAACNQSQPAAPTASAPNESRVAAPVTKDVYVIFEGPWAIATDPKDANSVLLLAPKTTHHRELYVTASNHATLTTGIYDLSFPGHVTPGAGTSDPAILRAKIDPANAQHALDSKAVRYAIRLPRPDAFLPSHRHRSRAGTTYPPDASTEQDYATALSLRYSVGSLSGFSLSGTPDAGTFNPLLLQVDIPAIRFVVEPTEGDDGCNMHSRQAFHDLVQLVGLTLYVDYPENPPSCHDKDPQIPHGGKAHAGFAVPLQRLTALLTGNVADVQSADASAGVLTTPYLRFVGQSSIAQRMAQRLGLAVYFFGASGTDCTGPGIDGH